jgi:hypothetical protein
LSDLASAVAVDASGNVYAAGRFSSPSVTFGSTVLVNVAYEDLFIVKYDPAGSVLWAKSVGGDYTEEVRTMAIDASGNLIVAGIFASSTLTFGPTTLVNAGNTDLFIAKYDSEGNVLWANSAGGYTGDYSIGVSTGPSDNIYFTGYSYSPSITFGNVTLTNQGLFLVKYTPGGNVIWVKASGGTHSLLPEGVAVDAQENAYVSGEYWNDMLVFFPDTLVNTNGNTGDVFLVKYDSGGNVSWAKSTGGYSIDYAQSVAADASGNAYLGGTFHSSWITFDTIILTNPDTTKKTGIFIAKYGPAGEVLWASKGLAAGDDQVSSLAVDGWGNSYLAGNFNCDTLDFGPVKLVNTSHGYTDIFVAKYDPEGAVQWATHAAGRGNEDTYSIAVDPPGNVYVSGMFKDSTLTFGSTVLPNLGWWDIFVAKLASGNVGMAEPDREGRITVYPNPASTILNMIVQAGSEIEISNLTGRVMQRSRYEDGRIMLDVSGLPDGLFFIRALSAGRQNYAKFIKR